MRVNLLRYSSRWGLIVAICLRLLARETFWPRTIVCWGQNLVSTKGIKCKGDRFDLTAPGTKTVGNRPSHSC